MYKKPTFLILALLVCAIFAVALSAYKNVWPVPEGETHNIIKLFCNSEARVWKIAHEWNGNHKDNSRVRDMVTNAIEELECAIPKEDTRIAVKHLETLGELTKDSSRIRIVRLTLQFQALEGGMLIVSRASTFYGLEIIQ